MRTALDRPIAIGRLQRHAVESYAAAGGTFFTPGEDAGVSVAIVGAGPAGLACAAELRRAGVAVTVYDAKPRAGGLGDHGIVPWRLPRETVALEVAAGRARRCAVRPGHGGRARRGARGPGGGQRRRWSWPSASGMASASASPARTATASWTRST